MIEALVQCQWLFHTMKHKFHHRVEFLWNLRWVRTTFISQNSHNNSPLYSHPFQCSLTISPHQEMDCVHFPFLWAGMLTDFGQQNVVKWLFWARASPCSFGTLRPPFKQAHVTLMDEEKHMASLFLSCCPRWQLAHHRAVQRANWDELDPTITNSWMQMHKWAHPKQELPNWIQPELPTLNEWLLF